MIPGPCHRPAPFLHTPTTGTRVRAGRGTAPVVDEDEEEGAEDDAAAPSALPLLPGAIVSRKALSSSSRSPSPTPLPCVA